MATLRDEASNYQPPTTKNIADLDKVPVDINVEDDQFKTTDSQTGEEKTVHQKVFVDKEGEKYRIPKSVLKQLKEHLEAKPNMKYFSVKASGQGLNTDYTVIPLDDEENPPVEKPGENPGSTASSQ